MSELTFITGWANLIKALEYKRGCKLQIHLSMKIQMCYPIQVVRTLLDRTTCEVAWMAGVTNSLFMWTLALAAHLKHQQFKHIFQFHHHYERADPIPSLLHHPLKYRTPFWRISQKVVRLKIVRAGPSHFQWILIDWITLFHLNHLWTVSMMKMVADREEVASMKMLGQAWKVRVEKIIFFCQVDWKIEYCVSFPLKKCPPP